MADSPTDEHQHSSSNRAGRLKHNPTKLLLRQRVDYELIILNRNSNRFVCAATGPKIPEAFVGLLDRCGLVKSAPLNCAVSGQRGQYALSVGIWVIGSRLRAGVCGEKQREKRQRTRMEIGNTDKERQSLASHQFKPPAKDSLTILRHRAQLQDLKNACQGATIAGIREQREPTKANLSVETIARTQQFTGFRTFDHTIG